MAVIDGDRPLIAALLGGDGQRAAVVCPGGEQVRAAVQGEGEVLLPAPEGEQGLTARVVGHRRGSGGGQHRVIHAQHSVNKRRAVQTVVVGPGGGGGDHAAVQIGDGQLVTSGVGEGGGLAGFAGGHVPIGRPPAHRPRRELVPVDHRGQCPQNQDRGDEQSQNAGKNIRFFQPFGLLCVFFHTDL